MKDYTKQCWSCGQVTMVNQGKYCLCSNCGATWNHVPPLGPDPLADSGYTLKSEAGVVLGHARRARPIRKSRARARSAESKA